MPHAAARITELRDPGQGHPLTAQPPAAEASAAPTLTGQQGWNAQLRCRFALRGERTVLAERSHQGPLLVQRPFYPEANGSCHLYLVHPPGGVASGDRLHFDAELQPGAQTLITTPAATKIYRSTGSTSHVENHFNVQAGAQLEWLPQETLLFSGANAVLNTRVELAGDAEFIGWEVMCLGRPACGERFERGKLAQSFEIYRDDRPLFIERSRCDGEDAVLQQPWGLAGQPVFATMICTTKNAAALVDKIRNELQCDASGRFAASALSEALVCRYIGSWAEGGRAYLTAVWHLLRPQLLNRTAIAPRIWAT